MSAFCDISLLSYNAQGLSDEGIAIGAWQPYANPPSSRASLPQRLRVLSWNTESVKDNETKELLASIKLASPGVVALQHVGPALANSMKADQDIRDGWIVTDYVHSTALSGSYFADLFLVRKDVLACFNGAKVVYCACEHIPCSVTYLELHAKGSLNYRFATTSNKGLTKAQRKRQFSRIVKLSASSDLYCCSASLTSPSNHNSTQIKSVFLGDTNIAAYEEIEPFLDAGYVDCVALTSQHALSPSVPNDAVLAEELFYSNANTFDETSKTMNRRNMILVRGPLDPIESTLAGDSTTRGNLGIAVTLAIEP